MRKKKLALRALFTPRTGALPTVESFSPRRIERLRLRDPRDKMPSLRVARGLPRGFFLTAYDDFPNSFFFAFLFFFPGERLRD